jgi:hypothetical protein
MPAPTRLGRFGHVLTILGLVVVLTYLTAALGVIRGPEKLLLALVFAIGPVAILGVLAIRRRLASGDQPFLPDAGAVFLVIGFALFNLMLVVQQYVRLRIGGLIGEAESEAAKETLQIVLPALDYVQQGIDVSFDIFYCVGVILLAAAMLRHPDFGRLLGLFGVVSAVALLVLNLAAFPHIPAESGLVDLGPLTGLWWLAVIVQMFRLDRRDRRQRRPDPNHG